MTDGATQIESLPGSRKARQVQGRGCKRKTADPSVLRGALPGPRSNHRKLCRNKTLQTKRSNSYKVNILDTMVVYMLTCAVTLRLHPRGRPLPSSPANLWSGSPGSSIPLLSYSCALFCAREKFNPSVFISLRALWQKHRGWGTPLHLKSPQYDLAASWQYNPAQLWP
jgi:hypothetical protein